MQIRVGLELAEFLYVFFVCRFFFSLESGRKNAHEHELFALVNIQMALGQTAGCSRVNRAKKFMCSPRNTGNINFSLWSTGGLFQGCPDFQKVYVFKVMCLFLALGPTEIARVGGKRCTLLGSGGSQSQPSEGINHLEASLPDALGAMQALLILMLSSNRLKGSLPDCLAQLTWLEEAFWLESNKLAGSSLTSVQYIALSDLRA